MRRRAFIAGVGSAAAWPLVARGQQPRSVIGFLRQGPPEPSSLRAAFSQGLKEAGIQGGRDITIEDRWAEGHYERLPSLAGDLVNRHVSVIAAAFLPAALAAKAATQTIPIVFLSGSDPIASGLVSSINRPTSNVTGIAPMFTLLGGKNLELLHELVPNPTQIGLLVKPSNPNAKPQVQDLQLAARTLGQELVLFYADNDRDIDNSFAAMAERRIGGLVVAADGFLIGRQDQIVSLAARYGIPTIYPLGLYARAGGLMSYGANLTDAYRQTGVYVGRVLKGAIPADLPVLQPTKVELLLNLKTAKALHLAVPPTLLAQADEVIE